jgi:nitrous oxidase accessory protein
MTRTSYPLLLVLVLLFSYSIKLHSKTIKVCPSCSLSTIEEALFVVEDYDTLVIGKGEYIIENIHIEKSISIIGESEAELISKSGDEILTIIASGVTIKGLTFRNVTTSYLKERAAIRIVKQKDFLLEDNYIKDCFFGIYLENVKSGVIRNNRIEGNATTEAESGNGVHAWYCSKLKITNNKVSGHRDGIYFEFVDESLIELNESFENKRYGLHFMFSNDDDYAKNIFRNNGVGVAVMFSSRITMTGNQFSLNWGRASYGLLLKEINDAEIIDNEFNENTIGIFVEGSNRINYFNNEFRQNGWAIKFSGGCSDNDISENNFINNSLDLIVNTKLASNQFHHNFWSGYSGYDLDHDGIGDVPHYPVKLFSYVLEQAPEAIVLLRSFFVDLINFSEKVSPVFTPKEVKDDFPKMTKVL